MNNTTSSENSTSASASASAVDGSLLTAPFLLNIYFGSLLWVVGNVGCLGNILVFSSKSFRKRAYSVYLFSAALGDLFYFNFVLMIRILQKGYRLPLTNSYTVICKLRQFATIWGNLFSFSLYSLATLDRLLSTQRSNKYRQWSSRLSLSYKMVVGCALLWFLFTVHRLILYRIKDGACNPPEGFYAYYDNYSQVAFSSLAPSIVMPVLAFLLIRNVRAIIKRRVAPAGEASTTATTTPAKPANSAINQMDAQLTLMLVLESGIAAITYLPYATQLTYANITQKTPKSALRSAWESVFTELIHLFSYVFFASSFYVSFASNTGYRRQLRRVFSGKKRADHVNRSGT